MRGWSASVFEFLVYFQSCIKYSTSKYQYQYPYQWSKYQYKYKYQYWVNSQHEIMPLKVTVVLVYRRFNKHWNNQENLRIPNTDTCCIKPSSTDTQSLSEC